MKNLVWANLLGNPFTESQEWNVVLILPVQLRYVCIDLDELKAVPQSKNRIVGAYAAPSGALLCETLNPKWPDKKEVYIKLRCNPLS